MNRKIDVHQHILPASYMKEIDRLGLRDIGAGGVPFPDWSVAGALETMDRHGIQVGMVSFASPGVWFGDAAEARRLARMNNETLAGLIQEHPTRFGGFASLPLPDTAGALAETSYALDKLGLDGVILLASVDDKYLGDPQFEELMQELNRRRAVVYVHPHLHSSSRKLGLGAPETLFEFIADTTRAVLNLLWTGTFERYPDIKWILSHAGGAVPYVAWRWSLGDPDPRMRARAPKGAVAYLSKLYYETALSVSPYAMKPVLDLAGPDHVLFGSDFPYASPPMLAREMRDLDALDVFDASSRAAMESGNALKLFPRLERVLSR
ncbi:MAG TPA: amidohydrolase family protein [Candidatus Polarisedimenticolaceae bacterium]|nr:amidohydrolase family protein [Candidatus Polarisedimenticolaceae bacterium]